MLNNDHKFTTLYTKYVDDVYQFLLPRTGFNVTQTEDLTQEIFAAIYKGLAGFHGFCSERTWVFRIARNRLNDYYRRCYAAPDQISLESNEALTNTLCDTQNMPASWMDETFRQEQVRACLEKLPIAYQTVLILKYFDEYSVKEIAAIVGRSPKAVESLLQRARKTFKKFYREMEEV